MKKLNIILLAVLGIFALSSCDDFLDIAPTNSGDAASAIQTEEDARIMMNGLMSRMTSSGYYGRNMLLYADAKGGDCTVYSNGNGNDWMFSYDQTEASGTGFGFWTGGYYMILQVNNMLKNIAEIEQNPDNSEDFDNIKGQAYTLRALLYFDLVRLYGLPYTLNKDAWGVPNVVEVIDASAQPLRAKVSENYAQILADLQAGAATITKSVIGQSSADVISYWANKALQARVYLTMGDYTNALAAAKEVIDSGKYKLYSNDEWIGSWKKQYQSESIFEIFMSYEDSDLGSSSLGGYFCKQKDYSGSLAPYGASDYYIARLNEDPTDIRHGIFKTDHVDRVGGSCYKYLGSLDKEGDGKESGSAVNIKVIRLSEMYLIAAEAAFATGDKAAAAEYLNAIRKRSPGLAPATDGTVTVDMILDEKSKEFYGEGLRFWDMVRLGKTIAYDDSHLGFTSPHRTQTIDTKTYPRIVLPISHDEIVVNPGLKAQQNAGY